MEKARVFEDGRLSAPTWVAADPKLNTVYILKNGEKYENLKERMG
jgi:hypothetical protein